jgi:hypothetical protein
LYGQRHIAYFDPSSKFEHVESTEQFENEDVVTMNNHRMKHVNSKISRIFNKSIVFLQVRDSKVRIKFELPPPPPIDDTIGEHIYEDIPTIISIPQISSSVSIQQQSTQTIDKDFIETEQSQLISSSPNSLDEALGNVEQWSDVIVDNDARELSSLRRHSQNSHILPSANEYVDEQYFAYSLKQPLAVSSAEVLDKTPSTMPPESKQDVPLLDEINVTLSQLNRLKVPQPYEYKMSADMPSTSATVMNGFHESIQDIPSNVNQLLPRESDNSEQEVMLILKENTITDISIPVENGVHSDQFHRAEDSQAFGYEAQAIAQRVSATFHTTPSASASEVEFEELSYDLRDQPKLIQNYAVLVETDNQTEAQSRIIDLRQQEEKEKSVSPQPSMSTNVEMEETRLEDQFAKTKEFFVNYISALSEKDVPLSSQLVVDILPSIEDISGQHNQLETTSSDQCIHDELSSPNNNEFSTKPPSNTESDERKTEAIIITTDMPGIICCLMVVEIFFCSFDH